MAPRLELVISVFEPLNREMNVFYVIVTSIHMQRTKQDY